MKLNLKSYENAYAGAPMKAKREEHQNTSALYGLETANTQAHLLSKNLYSSDNEYSALTMTTENENEH